MNVQELPFESAFYDDLSCVEKKFTSSDLQKVIDHDASEREKLRKRLADQLRFYRFRPSSDYKEQMQHKRWLFDMMLRTGVMEFEFRMMRNIPQDW